MTSRLAAGARRVLLAAARSAIECKLAGRAYVPPEAPAEVRAACGAFVTLRNRQSGELRGCIGFVEADDALLETVARAAVAAATNDLRFHAVALDELPHLRIEVSVLSPLVPIRPEDVEVGTHGLCLRSGRRAGLLLPQVAPEHGWDRDALLENLCRKAGVPRATWRQPDALLLGFTAEVFGEPAPPAPP